MKRAIGKEHAKIFAIYTAIFAVCCILVYGWFIKYDRLFLFKNDGVEQHLSALMYYGRYLRNIIKEFVFNHRIAISLWDFCLGYGSDVINTLHYYVIGDPFALLSVFVPLRYTEYLYCGLVILRSFAAGIAFYCYSISRGNGKFSSMIGSLNYAFCGYILYYGVRHPYFINAMIFLPIILLGIDRIYEKKRPTVFMITVALAAISNFYFFYVLSILMVLYAVFEYFCVYKYFSWKIVGKMFLSFVGYYLIAVMIAAVTLLPSIYAALTSNRMGNEKLVSVFYEEISYYGKLAIGFITTTNSIGLIFGFLSLAIPAVVLLFIRKGQNTLLKIGYLFVFSLFSLKVVGIVMNGFSYSSLRYCFILSLLVSYTIAKQIPELNRLEKKEVRLIGGISAVYIALAVVIAKGAELKTAAGVAAVTVFVIVFAADRVRHAKMWNAILLLITVVSITNNGYLFYGEDAGDYIQRDCVGSQTDALINSQLGMVCAIEDASFYRSEANDYILNTATALDIPSTSYYYSLINSNLSEFMVSQGNLLSSMGYKLLDTGKRAILDSVFSVKYYVTDETKEDSRPYGFNECVLRQNGYAVYRNENCLPFGYTYDAIITESEYEELRMLDRQYALLQAAVVPDGYMPEIEYKKPAKTSYECEYEKLASTKIRVENDYILVRKAKAKLKVRVKNVKGSELYLCFEGMRFKNGKGKSGRASFSVLNEDKKPMETFMVRNLDNKFFSGTEDFCVNAGYQDGEDAVIILQFNNTGTYYFEDFSFQAQPMFDFKERVDALSRNTLQNIEFDVNRITGDITVDKTKILCLSIPYTTGWSVYVDGKKQETIQLCKAFTGVELGAGEHHIELRYFTPGLRLGICLSVLGGILLIWICRKNEVHIQEKLGEKAYDG